MKDFFETIGLNAEQIALLVRYNEILVGYPYVNLTAHKSSEDSLRLNAADSLLFVDVFRDLKGRMLDIGSGGGCPAIPIKIACPHLDVTMIDSVNKKVEFLKNAVFELGLAGISAVHARVEEYPARESYDVVTARAVAPLNTLLEYALPFVCVGGVFVAFKGPRYAEELEFSKTALGELGGEVLEVKTAYLPGGDEILRAAVIIKKVKPTPGKYPRGKNLPRLRPL